MLLPAHQARPGTWTWSRAGRAASLSLEREVGAVHSERESEGERGARAGRGWSTCSTCVVAERREAGTQCTLSFSGRSGFKTKHLPVLASSLGPGVPTTAAKWGALYAKASSVLVGQMRKRYGYGVGELLLPVSERASFRTGYGLFFTHEMAEDGLVAKRRSAACYLYVDPTSMINLFVALIGVVYHLIRVVRILYHCYKHPSTSRVPQKRSYEVATEMCQLATERTSDIMTWDTT